MHRESVFVCTYTAGANERVAHVRAWNGREAAELFKREIELEVEGGPDFAEPRLADIRVRPASRAHGRRETTKTDSRRRGR